MLWLSRNNFTPTDAIHADDLNNLANDQRAWGGDVNGGGHNLSNVTITGLLTDPTTTKGDLIVRGVSTLVRLGAGPDGQVLTADSTQATGIKWAAPAGAVASVFTRTGAVVAAAGDYTAAQVTNAVSTIGSYADPAWITSLAYSKITGAPAAGVPTTRQVIAGAGLSGGGALSADVTLSAVALGASGASHAAGIVPDPGATVGATRYLREDATWAVPSGTGGGLTDPTTTKGDIMVRGAAAVTRLGVGTDGQVLMADSTQATGIKWAAAGGGSQTPWTGDINAASFKLNTVGAIGIGTAAGTTNGIYINGSAIFDAVNQINTSSNGWAGINLQNDAGHTAHLLLYGSARTPPDIARLEMSATDFALVFAANEKVRFTATGRLGIGTTTPGVTLDVNGTASFGGVGGISAYTPSAGLPTLGFNTYAAYLAGAAGFGAALQFTNSSGALTYYNAPNVAAGATRSFTAAVTITAAGNVGIGATATAPAYSLDVVGSIHASGSGVAPASCGSIIASPSDGRAFVAGPWVDMGGNANGWGIFASNAYTNFNDKTIRYSNTHASLGASGILLETSFGGAGNAIGFFVNPGATTADATFTPSVKMVIDPNGFVGIGTTAPRSALNVASPGLSLGVGGASINAEFTLDTTGHTGIALGYDTGGQIGIIVSDTGGNPSSLAFWTFNSGWFERLRISAVGNVGIGTPSPAHLLQLATDDAAKPATSAWTVASDLRLKRNIQPFHAGLEVLTKLHPISYEYNGEDGTPDGLKGVGLIAQHVAEIIPGCLRRALGRIGGEETEVLSLNISDLTWLMVNAFREIDGRLRAAKL